MKFYPTEPATLHEDLTRYAAVVGYDWPRNAAKGGI